MILLVTQNFPPDTGGIETLMGGLAAQLAASGREVRVPRGAVCLLSLGRNGGNHDDERSHPVGPQPDCPGPARD